MAINQASFFLFPPRYIPDIELDHESKTFSCDQLKLIDAQLADSDAPIVPAKQIRSWFLARGQERWSGVSVLGRGHENTFLGKQDEITISIPLDEEEIDLLYIRFLLTEKTPTQWDEWESLIWALGTEFQFQLMAPDESLVPCIDFFTVLLNNHNLRMFQNNHTWNTDRSS